MSSTAPDAQVPRPKKELTDFAKRFGVGTASFHKGYKSGLTPLTPLFSLLNPPPSKSKYRQRIQLERWQRNELYGFTTRELKALGALPLFEEVQTGDLKNALHPIFRIGNWETQQTMPRCLPMIPIGHGKPGFYEANNEEVWEKMLPCLRLASKFLTASHLSPWWDALIFGRFEIFDDDPEGDGDLARFFRRPPNVVFQNKQKVQDTLVGLANAVRFQFRDGRRNVATGLFDEGFFSGATSPRTNMFPFIRVLLDTRLVERLLFRRCTEAQTLAMQLEMAETLVHETAHALWFSIRKSPGLSSISLEPYYETEGIRELGYSMTQAIFGSMFEPLMIRSDLGFATKNFPTEEDLCQPSWGPFVGSKEDLQPEDHFPLPVQWINEVQLTDFWEFHVMTYGSFKVGPCSYGMRRVGFGLQLDVFEGQESTFHDRTREMHLLDIDSSVSSLRAARIENSRRRRARIAAAAFRATRDKTEILARAMVSEDMKRSAGVIDDPNQEIQDAVDDLLADLDLTEMAHTLQRVYTLENQDMGRKLERAFLAAPADESDSDDDVRNDTSKKDDGPMAEPPCFARIRSLFLEHQVRLSIDTMFGIFPTNSVLSYLNNVIDPPLVSPEDFSSFLKYCHVGPVRQLFAYAEKGGIVRIFPGWRVLDESDLPDPIYYDTAVHPQITEALRTWCIRNEFALGRKFPDWDVDLIWRAFIRTREHWSHMSEDSHLMLQLVDEDLDDMWIRGPEGIIRWDYKGESDEEEGE